MAEQEPFKLRVLSSNLRRPTAPDEMSDVRGRITPMKRCCTCHVLRSLEEFHRRSTSPDGRQRRCMQCYADQYRDHRRALGAKVRARSVPLRLDKEARLAAYLRDHPCVDCGESDVRVLEFDHRDPQLKLACIARMFTGGWTWQAMLGEIEKCDVRCANCHRVRTSLEQNWWKHRLQLRNRAVVFAAAQDRLTSLLPDPAGLADTAPDAS